MAERFYRIGEVAEMLNLKSHVLRFWETEFSQLQPLRTDSGQRLYTDEHVDLVRRIRQLLHEQGMTIEGAKRVLCGGDDGGISQPFPMQDDEFLVQVQTEIGAICNLLRQGPTP